MKIIVIGAGLMGLSSALYLSRQGHEVIVIDRQSGPAEETSYANAGLLHPSQAGPWNHPGIALQIIKWMGKEDSPFLLRPAAIPSLLGWGFRFMRHASPDRFRANLKANTRLANYTMQCLHEFTEEHGFDYGASALGSMKIFENKQDLEKELALIPVYESLGVVCEALKQDAILDIEPALLAGGANLIGGIRYPGDEAGDAYRFCQQLNKLTRNNNVRFEYGLSVQKILRSAMKITGIETSRGLYTGDAYVLAAGSYSPRLAAGLGLNIPVRPVKGYSVTLDMQRWETRPRMPVIDEQGHVAITPLGERLRAAGTAELNGYDTRINRARIQLILDRIITRYPFTKVHINADQINAWTGLRPTSADGVPIIGESAINNLFLNTGHGHLGWSLCMGSGKLLADLISGQKTGISLSPYALARF